MDTRLNEPSYKLHYKRGGITNLKAIFGTWCKPTVYTPRRIAPAGINSGISRRHKDADPRWQVNIAIIPVYGRGRAWKLLMRPSGARHPCQRLALNPPCLRKFKRSTSYFCGMIHEVAENERAYPICAISRTELRLFRFRWESFRAERIEKK